MKTPDAFKRRLQFHIVLNHGPSPRQSRAWCYRVCFAKIQLAPARCPGLTDAASRKRWLRCQFPLLSGRKAIPFHRTFGFIKCIVHQQKDVNIMRPLAGCHERAIDDKPRDLPRAVCQIINPRQSLSNAPSLQRTAAEAFDYFSKSGLIDSDRQIAVLVEFRPLHRLRQSALSSKSICARCSLPL